MLPLVPGQLVAAGEPPAAARPAAHVGLLPGVGADVSLHIVDTGSQYVNLIVSTDLSASEPFVHLRYVQQAPLSS